MLAGLPADVPGATINRLCGSGLDAVASASRMIGTGEADIVIAGGVESMSRAPYVMSKSAAPFARDVQMFDTTIGWRFVESAAEEELRHRLDARDRRRTSPSNSASRARIRTASRCAASSAHSPHRPRGLFAAEIVAVAVPAKRGETTLVSTDEHPRETSLEALAKLPTPFRAGGTVTAGNSSGVNDGACALAARGARGGQAIRPQGRVRASSGPPSAGVEPRIMGIGPVAATRKLLARLGLTLADIDLIELNEAFAAQALAVLRELGIPDDAAHVNPQGGAIALGHPLGASGARLAATALYQLERNGGRRALCTMCIGVGQGIAMVIERLA